MSRHLLAAAVALLVSGTALGATGPSIVAAENFYGSVAAQVVPNAKVTSILSNPNQDPHEFQTDAKTAMAVAGADIVIFSGIGYDDRMQRLLSTGGRSDRMVINVSEMIGAKSGDNPHIWYDPKTMPALVAKLASLLSLPKAEADFATAMQPLLGKIQALRSRTVGMKVTATEPVFGYMADALGFEMLDEGYQLAVQQGIPVVGVFETQLPDAETYVGWMLDPLNDLEKVLP